MGSADQGVKPIPNSRSHIQAHAQRQEGEHVPGKKGIGIAQAHERDRQQDGRRRVNVALEEDPVRLSPVIHVAGQADLLRLVNRPTLEVIARRRPFLHEVSERSGPEAVEKRPSVGDGRERRRQDPEEARSPRVQLPRAPRFLSPPCEGGVRGGGPGTISVRGVQGIRPRSFRVLQALPQVAALPQRAHRRQLICLDISAGHEDQVP